MAKRKKATLESNPELYFIELELESYKKLPKREVMEEALEKHCETLKTFVDLKSFFQSMDSETNKSIKSSGWMDMDSFPEWMDYRLHSLRPTRFPENEFDNNPYDSELTAKLMELYMKEKTSNVDKMLIDDLTTKLEIAKSLETIYLGGEKKEYLNAFQVVSQYDELSFKGASGLVKAENINDEAFRYLMEMFFDRTSKKECLNFFMELLENERMRALSPGRLSDLLLYILRDLTENDLMDLAERFEASDSNDLISEGQLESLAEKGKGTKALGNLNIVLRLYKNLTEVGNRSSSYTNNAWIKSFICAVHEDEVDLMNLLGERHFDICSHDETKGLSLALIDAIINSEIKGEKFYLTDHVKAESFKSFVDVMSYSGNILNFTRVLGLAFISEVHREYMAMGHGDFFKRLETSSDFGNNYRNTFIMLNEAVALGVEADGKTGSSVKRGLKRI